MTSKIKETHSRFLTELFAEFEAESIEYSIVRNFELLPQEIDDDIDILVAKPDLLRIESLISQLLSSTFVIVKIVRRNYHLQIYITAISTIRYAITKSEPVDIIELDFVTELQWRGVPYISAASALANRQRHSCFFILHLDDYISHLICHAILDKREFSEKYWNEVSRYFSGNNQKCPKTLLSFFGSSLSEQFAIAVRRQDPNVALTIRRGLIRRMLTRPTHLVEYAKYAASRYRRILRALVNPPGLLLTAVGPDGVGKTTLLLRVSQTLGHCFQPVEEVYMGWKDFILPTKRLLLWVSREGRKRTGRRETSLAYSEHRQEGADDGPSWIHIFSVAHYFLDLYVRYFFRILPQLARGGLVLCDRYFYDMFWQKLYLTDTSAFRKSLVKVSPLPTLTVVFSGDPELIAARKQEMSATETALQIATFQKLLELNARTIELDASAPLEENVLTVIQGLIGSPIDGRSS